MVTSLARAVQESGHNTEIILPKYDCLNYKYVSLGSYSSEIEYLSLSTEIVR